MLVHGDAAQRPDGLELLARYREASLEHGYATDAVRYVSTEFAKEKARIGDIDGAVQTARGAVEFCFDSGDMAARGPAVATLVESLLRRGGQGDLMEAGHAIERLAAVPVDPGFVLHELPLLRMRALLARAHGDEAGYRDFADRYRDMADRRSSSAWAHAHGATRKLRERPCLFTDTPQNDVQMRSLAALAECQSIDVTGNCASCGAELDR